MAKNGRPKEAVVCKNACGGTGEVALSADCEEVPGHPGIEIPSRMPEESESPNASASVLPSFVKLSATTLRQRICSFMVRIAGMEG